MSLAPGNSPFDKVWRLDRKGKLGDFMRECGFGTPYQFARGFTDAADKLSLPEDLTVAKLETVNRIGPKTARLVVHNAFPEWGDRAPEDRKELAILDRLILRWMRKQKGCKDAPVDTPQNPKTYAKWEAKWGELKDKCAGDLELWNELTRTPPEDWKTRPIVRKIGGEPRWWTLDGVELRREKVDRKVKFFKGKREFATAA